MPWPKGKHLYKEQKAKIRKAMSRLYRGSAAKKKISDSLKRYYQQNPTQSARIRKIDNAVTDWWKEHPSARKRHSQKIKDFFIKNPGAFEEFLKHGKNPLKKHLRTRQGFLVRSKGEKRIAEFLYENKIPCLYESISLPITTPPFAGNICTPDFYIPSLNIFIEFYGGYPAAWKKKVLKNKLYKAHKIPVLGITPAELNDLDYYLLKQGKQLSETKMAREFKIRKWIR